LVFYIARSITETKEMSKSKKVHWLGNTRERGNLEEIGIDGRAELKWVLKMGSFELHSLGSRRDQ
jgi:hypothetical protein